MIENIYNSQKNLPSSLETSEPNMVLPALAEKNGQGSPVSGQKEGDSKAYEVSFSDRGWEAFDKKAEKTDSSKEKGRDSTGKKELTEEEKRQVEELKKIDQKVKTHEQAHLSAAGGYARGGANYEYITGPDGKRYANAGHVNLDTSPEKTPEATIQKANVIRKAALAPADPSPADRQIASDAIKMEQKAREDLIQERLKEDKAASSKQPTISSSYNQHPALEPDPL